jgi:multidrug efflux pump subunit AcrA (membrane-fusion protein)
MSANVSDQQAEPATEQLPLTPHDRAAEPTGRRRRKAPWVIALVVVLIAAGVAVVLAKPFSSAAGSPGVTDNADATGIYTVARGDLSSQTQVSATIGYQGSYSIPVPSGSSAEEVAQDQQTVTEDQQTLSADEQTESDMSSAGAQGIAADQSDVTTDQATLNSDQATENQDCAGSGVSSAACSQAEQKVSADQTQLTQAQQQLTTAQSTATLDRDQNQAKVLADQTKLTGDQATLASLQATELNPGTAYTSLPQVGDVIKDDQPVYSVNNEAVPLLYGSLPDYRAFSDGMSDGADVGELTADLIALGDGAGLTQSNHYSTATAAAVERVQNALGLPATGEILLGAVVFEPGPIRVTSVTPSVGESVAGGGGGGSGSGGGGSVLSATSTTRQVSIALDATDQSEVAVGDKVTIALPNNENTPGVISSVGTVATTPSSSSSASSGPSSPTITVLVNPTDPAATGTWDQASVNVTITTGSVTNALVVPVAALRAQPTGGYALEVVGAEGIHHLMSVTLGLFDDADGLVQVTGTDLAAGERVVVPKL